MAGKRFGETSKVMNGKETSHNKIPDLETIVDLWSKTYNTEGRPDWSHILPYYDDQIEFRDSVQGLRGMVEFRAMTERLTERSKDLKFNTKIILRSSYAN